MMRKILRKHFFPFSHFKAVCLYLFGFCSILIYSSMGLMLTLVVFRYSPSMPFYKIMVPTVDSVRYDFLLQTLINAKRPVLLTGPVGTGKTSVAQKVCG